MAHHEVLRPLRAHDFVICLGHQAEAIKSYFLNYNEAVANDFVLSEGGTRVELMRTDLVDWRITFVDTGLQSSVGERLRRIQPYLEGEEYLPRALRRHSDRCAAAADDRRAVTSGKVATLPLRAAEQLHLPHRHAQRRAAGARRSGTFAAPTSGSTAASSSCATTIFDVIEPGEELVRPAVPAPHRAR